MVILKSPLDAKQSLSSCFFRSHEDNGHDASTCPFEAIASNDGPEKRQNKERASKGHRGPSTWSSACFAA
jgi:hypothetical protein